MPKSLKDACAELIHLLNWTKKNKWRSKNLDMVKRCEPKNWYTYEVNSYYTDYVVVPLNCGQEFFMYILF